MIPDVLRYFAFISYSRADKPVAEWLQRSLETFRVPGHLVGRPTADGPVPRFLGRFFRDQSELGASEDLGNAVRAALSGSRHLIVICSPEAARSKWVDAEIRQYRELNPKGRIFAIVARGQPTFRDVPDACFPPALAGAVGTSVGDGEPLAPDLREGRNIALLKLVAGLVSLPFDGLYRRHRRRSTLRKFTWAAAAAVVAICVAYPFAWLTQTNRSRALAAAAANEYSASRVHAAVVLATAALPDPNSPFRFFWPEDAATQLRRSGVHQSEPATPGEHFDNSWVVKDRWLAGFRRAAQRLDILELATRTPAFSIDLSPYCSGAGQVACHVLEADLDEQAQRVIFQLNEGRVVIADRSGRVSPLSNPICTATETNCEVRDLSLSPDGRIAVLATARRGTVTIIDLQSGRSLTHDFRATCRPGPDAPNRCSDINTRAWVSPTSDFVVATNFTTSVIFQVTRWTAIPISQPLIFGSFGAGATFIGGVTYADRITTIDLATGRTVGEFTIGGCVYDLHDTPNSAIPAFYVGKSRPCQMAGLTLSHDRRLIAVALINGPIVIVSSDGTRTERRIPLHCVNPTQRADSLILNIDFGRRGCGSSMVRFSGDGTLIAAVNSDHTVRAWRVADGSQLLDAFLGGDVRQLAFEPGRHVLVGGSGRWRVGETRDATGAALRQQVCSRQPGLAVSRREFDRLRNAYPMLQLSEDDRCPCGSGRWTQEWMEPSDRCL